VGVPYEREFLLMGILPSPGKPRNALFLRQKLLGFRGISLPKKKIGHLAFQAVENLKTPLSQ